MIRLPLLAVLAACAAPTDEGRGPAPIDDTGGDAAGEDEGQQRERIFRQQLKTALHIAYAQLFFAVCKEIQRQIV